MAAATNSDTNPDEIDLELTHEEIWDDSVLVQAWDEALKEYKKYHSIAAKGEDAEALIRAAETETVMGDALPAAKPEDDDDGDGGGGGGGDSDARQQVGTSDAEAAVPEPLELSEPPELLEPPEEPPAPQEPVRPPEPAFPFAQLHPEGPAAGYAIGGNDQGMRNLMMAWYWAGYYSGLHEWQQKQQQQQQQQ